MFARVSVYEIPEGRENEAVRSFDEALGQIGALRGFVDGYFLVSRESNRGIAITFWVDHDAMTGSRVMATRMRGAAIEAVEGEVLNVDEFEVAVHRAPPEND